MQWFHFLQKWTQEQTAFTKLSSIISNFHYIRKDFLLSSKFVEPRTEFLRDNFWVLFVASRHPVYQLGYVGWHL